MTADAPPVNDVGSAAELVAGLAPGTKIDRFEIVRLVGEGGMGAVYEARDPDLARAVALKLIHEPDAQRSMRLLREAQALAQLQHPNVVAVHEVGTDGDRVYIAMELVLGESLDRHGRRPWREVVALGIQAGRGLAAAHAKDLVHRDVKPSNILLGVDGRVRVGDFGLARLGDAGTGGADRDAARDPQGGAPAAAVTVDGGATEPGAAEVGLATPRAGLLGSTLTGVGAYLGTPRYMAPEQHARRPATAKSDQFSFCVALWELIFDAHPFVEDREGGWAASVIADRRRPRPPGAPRWLVRALDRGLARDPDARHGSMTALCDLLERTPARRRRIGIAVTAAAVLATAVVAAGRWTSGGAAAVRCERAGDGVAAVWTDAARARLAASVGQVTPVGADTAQRTAALVDGWAARWRATRIEACRAHQRGEQSATIFDRRMACLDAELATAGEVLDRVAAGGPAAVRNAFTAIAALPAPEACAADRLQQAMPLPYDPRVAAIAADRAAAQAAIAVADVPEARRRIVAALAAAEALDHPGVLAQVLLDGAAIGVAEDPRAALAALERALTLATAAGDPDLQAVATLRLLDDATTRNDAKAAESLLPVARAAVARPGVPRTVGNDFVESEALALIAIGRFDEALAACAQIAVAEPPPQVRATQCRCGAYVTMSDYDGAELHCTAALAAAEQHFGATHPAITSRLGQLVKAYRLRGRGEAALALAERALTIDEAAYGPESFAVSADLCSKGSALTEVQRLAEAQLAVERCLAIRTRLDGAGPPSRGAGEAEQQLAEILVAAGNVDEGLVRADRALAIFEQTIAPETPEMVWAYATHGNLSVAGDRWASVERSMGRCIELALQVHGANHPLRVMCLLGLAQALIAADRAADAVPNARQGLDALIAMRAAPYNIAVAHGVLGAALGRSGDRRGARRQLDEAIALFDSLGAAGADGAAEAREQRAQF